MTEQKTIAAYKAFDKDWKCRDFQYEIGKTYEMEGPIVPCERGFHACTIPTDVWSYYDITESKIARVTVVDPVAHEGDSKVASAKITIEAELSIPQWIGETVRAILALCDKDTKKTAASGNYSTLAASGNCSTLAASGNCSTLAASGNYSTLAASGNCSTLAASGNCSTLAASGDRSKLAASGDRSKLAASGDGSTLAASGYRSRGKIGENGAICLAWYDGKRPRFAVGYEGENGIKADTWYQVDSIGNLVECAQ